MKRHIIYSILLLPLLLLSLVSCNKLVYDRGECPTILVFTPYTQTPCMSNSAYIGKAGYMDIVISAPSSGEIIAYKHLEPADLTAASRMETPVPSEYGETYRYTIQVGAAPQHYTMSDLVPVSGNKHLDCRLALRLNEQDRHEGLPPGPLYFAIDTIECPMPPGGSTIRIPVAPNLTRYSNDFDISLTELPSKVIYSFHIEIEDNNAAYNFMGQLTNPTKHVIYQVPLPNEGTTRSTRLSTPRLDDPRTLPQLNLVRSGTGAKTFTYDPGKLLVKEPDYRPECQSEYDIKTRLKTPPDNTHYAVDTSVDGWRVHSYEIEL